SALATAAPSDRAIAMLARARFGSGRYGEEIPAFWPSVLARSPAPTAPVVSLLQKMWNEHRNDHVTAETVALAWALWRVDPKSMVARDVVLDSLSAGSDAPDGGSEASRPALESVARLAESGDALRDAAGVIYERLERRSR